MFLPTTGGRKWEEIYDWHWFPSKPSIENTEAETFKSLTPKTKARANSGELICFSPRTSNYSQPAISDASPSHKRTLLPDPILSFTQVRILFLTQKMIILKQVLGYSPNCFPSIIWLPGESSKKATILFASFKNIVMMDIMKSMFPSCWSDSDCVGDQKIFLGHSANISCFSIDIKGILMASAQEGKGPLIRVWDLISANCLGVLCSHESDICSLSISDNGNMLAAVGKDRHAKQQIILWDISQLAKTGL